MKYARFLPEKERRETWEEIVDRNVKMHSQFYEGKIDSKEIESVFDRFVKTKKVLPSMRSMQFGGKPILLSPNRIYNCAYMPINDVRSFSEAMFLLLGGTGVGYSIQTHHIRSLPSIRPPSRRDSQLYLVNDSIEGWADAVKTLVESYIYGTHKVEFDLSKIRSKGERLVTSGGRSPGPAPLNNCLGNIENLLSSKEKGSKLSSLECHDIMCYIADAVLAGGIRRAAMISLFSFDDREMVEAKAGQWWENNPQRGRANNSAVIVRDKISENQFFALMNKIEESGSGEPGFYFTNDKNWGTNPCCEIALQPFQFCNLTEINAATVESQEDFEERAKAASFIGTLQAGYTNFTYLREIWQETTEREALIGVSMTGIAAGKVTELDMASAAAVVKSENCRVACLIDINTAARTTCVKPAGTTSLSLGTSSGIHAYHAPHYIRRIRIGKTESLYEYLNQHHSSLVEDEAFSPETQAVISMPQKSPKGAVTRNESTFDLLNRVKKVSNEWVNTGHSTGLNTHNVSATISIKDNEWASVSQWMWKNRECYNGLAVLPYDGGAYTQAPFEECDEETFEHLSSSLHSVDLSAVKEEEDNTDLSGELACAGGACEISITYPPQEVGEQKLTSLLRHNFSGVSVRAGKESFQVTELEEKDAPVQVKIDKALAIDEKNSKFITD